MTGLISLSLMTLLSIPVGGAESSVTKKFDGVV